MVVVKYVSVEQLVVVLPLEAALQAALTGVAMASIVRDPVPLDFVFVLR